MKPLRQKAYDAVSAALSFAIGDDGSSVDLPGTTHRTRVLEGPLLPDVGIPEGSWRAWGHTVSAREIAAVAGTDKNMGRLKELQENTAKLKAARVS